MKHARLVSLIVFLVILNGCITYGREFDVTLVSRIERGKTTKAEIQALFGSPASVSTSPDLEMWIYQYERRMAAVLVKEIYGAGAYGSQARPEVLGRTTLTVIFNSKGVVTDYTLTQLK